MSGTAPPRGPAPGDRTPPAAPPAVLPSAPLRRDARHKVLAGVAGGLGRHCDMDPVIFRIVFAVLSVTGGAGLIFYGFAWLLIPLDDEEESEGRRLLTGRVDGAALSAVCLALAGCGVFLTMLNSQGVLAFAALLSLTVAGAGVWSRRRRTVPGEGDPLDPATAHAVAEAPPETKAPPAPESPSWWRDPIGRETPAPPSYLWGPEGAVPGAPGKRTGGPSTGAAGAERCRTAGRAGRGGTAIGGWVFGLAVVAAVLGVRLSWEGHPLGTSLQIGAVCALGVFGLGLLISSFLGRTGSGTVLMTVLTAMCLAAVSALPKDIGTRWTRTEWAPASVSSVRPVYELDLGVGTLDLSRVTVPAGTKAVTRAEVEAGKLRVVLPANAAVTVVAKTGFGDIKLPGDTEKNFEIRDDNRRTEKLPAPKGAVPSGTLELRLEVGVGQVEVARAAS
jgi:phage shock protein PspC (stress-responsive transcriptional regulator)